MIRVNPENGPDDYTALTKFQMTLSGVPDMKQWKRTFAPDRLVLQYEYSSEHGQWKLDQWSISGPMRLKDGRLSQTLRPDVHGWSWKVDDGIPEWLSITIDQYRPTGTITYTHTGTDIGDE